MSDSALIIGKNIKSERIQLGLSQRDLAKKVNIATDTLGRIERGSGAVAMEKIEGITKALKVTMVQLLEERPDVNVNPKVIRGNIKRIMREKKISPVKLSNDSEIEFPSIRNILAGHRPAGPKSVVKIAKALGVTSSELRYTAEAWKLATGGANEQFHLKDVNKFLSEGVGVLESRPAESTTKPAKPIDDKISGDEMREIRNDVTLIKSALFDILRKLSN